MTGTQFQSFNGLPVYGMPMGLLSYNLMSYGAGSFGMTMPRLGMWNMPQFTSAFAAPGMDPRLFQPFGMGTNMGGPYQPISPLQPSLNQLGGLSAVNLPYTGTIQPFRGGLATQFIQSLAAKGQLPGQSTTYQGGTSRPTYSGMQQFFQSQGIDPVQQQISNGLYQQYYQKFATTLGLNSSAPANQPIGKIGNAAPTGPLPDDVKRMTAQQLLQVPAAQRVKIVQQIAQAVYPNDPTMQAFVVTQACHESGLCSDDIFRKSNAYQTGGLFGVTEPNPNKPRMYIGQGYFAKCDSIMESMIKHKELLEQGYPQVVAAKTLDEKFRLIDQSKYDVKRDGSYLSAMHRNFQQYVKPTIQAG